MSDHETTLRELTEGIYIDASLPLLQLAPAEKAACLAGADALRRGTWQPIASAPKDGHAVIGLTWNREVFVVFWSHFYNTWRHADDGWCSGSAPRLTHWMPLPDAPTETTR